jgi:hypothetical protein
VGNGECTNGEFRATISAIIQQVMWHVDYLFERSITEIAAEKDAHISGEEYLFRVS